MLTTEEFEYKNNDWIAGEYPPLLSEEGTLDAGDLKRFTFLTIDNSTFNYVEWDGTGRPEAILINDTDATAGAEPIQVWVGGNFFWHNLIYDTAVITSLEQLRDTLTRTKFIVTDASLNNPNIINPA